MTSGFIRSVSGAVRFCLLLRYPKKMHKYPFPCLDREWRQPISFQVSDVTWQEDTDERTHTWVLPTAYQPLISLSGYLKHLYEGWFFSSTINQHLWGFKLSVHLHTWALYVAETLRCQYTGKKKSVLKIFRIWQKATGSHCWPAMVTGTLHTQLSHPPNSSGPREGPPGCKECLVCEDIFGWGKSNIWNFHLTFISQVSQVLSNWEVIVSMYSLIDKY